jgi:hypothetical protein
MVNVLIAQWKGYGEPERNPLRREVNRYVNLNSLLIVRATTHWRHRRIKIAMGSDSNFYWVTSRHILISAYFIDSLLFRKISIPPRP